MIYHRFQLAITPDGIASMIASVSENSTVATTATNTTKRIRDDTESGSTPVHKCHKSIHTSDDEPDDDFDIFSAESKKMLATMISRCPCGGWRICGPCFKEQKPTLVDSDSDEKVDQETPPLCKRDEDTCGNHADSVGMLPCIVCKRFDDDEEENKNWYSDYSAREDLICDYNICPGCLGSISSDICPNCKTDNDI